MQRWVVLAAAVLIQTILGSVYAWSTFVPSLIEEYGLTRAHCGFIFGMLFALFTVSMTVSGRLLVSHGPKLVAAIAAVCFGAGYGLAAFSDGAYLLLLVAVGGLVGISNGFGYVGPLTVGMKWFPDKKGLITGIVVAGFGLGAVLLSAVGQRLLATGMDVLTFFGWMGAVLGPVLFIAAMGMASPPAPETKSHKGNAFAVLRTLPFWLVTLGMFSGTCAGLMIIGNLTLIVEERGLSVTEAVLSISIFAVGNAAGRIGWGHAFDRYTYLVIPASLAFFCGVILLLLVPLPAVLMLLLTGLLGFGFGACFVVYASSLSRYFGVEMFPQVYPLCFLGYGVAGILGPTLGGWLADLNGTFTLPILLGAGLVGLTSIVTLAGMSVFRDEGSAEAALVNRA